MKCILFELPDGTLVTRGGFGPRFMARFSNDLDKALTHVLTELVPVQNPDAINPRIEDVTFPSDKEFRAAWKSTPGKIEVDMPKARLIHMDRIRVARDAELEEKDKLWMRAMGQKDQVLADAIEAERQALRDIPQTVDLTAAMTPGELTALWPSIPPTNVN